MATGGAADSYANSNPCSLLTTWTKSRPSLTRISLTVMVNVSALTRAGVNAVDVARARKIGTMRDIIDYFNLLSSQRTWPGYNKKPDATKRQITR